MLGSHSKTGMISYRKLERSRAFVDKFAELLLATRVTLWVCAARVCLWALSFRRTQRIIDFLTPDVPEEDVLSSVEQLSRAVSSASRYVPHATCLTQAVALHFLLKRGGFESRVRIGVAKNNGEFESHAWVESQGRVVLGDIGLQYTPILDWD
jgi:hypothetical protein